MEQKNNSPFLAFTRICLNNWHYISRKILSLNKEINFFTGHSGTARKGFGQFEESFELC